MRVIVQKVLCASVEVEDIVERRIGAGLVVFVGIRNGDSPAEAAHLANLVVKLQLFLR